MTITVKTNDVTGQFDTEDMQAVQALVNSHNPMISIGADYMTTKDDVISFYSGEPEEEATNTYKITARSGGVYVINLPEGENAKTLSDKINKHAEGKEDRFGNRIVTEPFIVLGDDTSAVGLRYNDIKSAVKVSRTEPTQ